MTTEALELTFLHSTKLLLGDVNFQNVSEEHLLIEQLLQRVFLPEDSRGAADAFESLSTPLHWMHLCLKLACWLVAPGM